jgi:hypothetical protein
MTELKSQYKLSWASESALGTTNQGAWTALAAGDTAYLIGDYRDASIINLKSEQEPFRLTSAYSYDALGKKKLVIDLELNFLLMNGIPFYYALGAVSNGDDGGVKTHACSLVAPGTARPSFTLHYEATDVDSTSNIYKDILGCRVDEMILQGSRYGPIAVTLKCQACEILDSVHLTNDPALKATAVDTAFGFGDGTFTWNSNSQDHVEALTMRIKNNLKRTWVDRTTTYYRAKYIDSWEHQITWAMVLVLKNKTLLDEIKTATARTFSVAWQRTDADDKITTTLASSLAHEGMLQNPPFEKNTYTLAGTAKTASTAVRDAIATYP